MNNQNTFNLSLKTAIQLFTDLHDRIEHGSLPTDLDGILDAIDFYKNYFTYYTETGDTYQQKKATICLTYIPLMLGTLKWREAKANAIFYSEL